MPPTIPAASNYTNPSSSSSSSSSSNYTYQTYYKPPNKDKRNGQYAPYFDQNASKDASNTSNQDYNKSRFAFNHQPGADSSTSSSQTKSSSNYTSSKGPNYTSSSSGSGIPSSSSYKPQMTPSTEDQLPFSMDQLKDLLRKFGVRTITYSWHVMIEYV